jgi:hypothetical protein
MMVMVITIVVIFSMTAVCGYLANVSKNQHEANKDTLLFADADATLHASAKVVEYSIKKQIKDMIPEGISPGDQDLYFNVNTFMTSHADTIRDLVATISVMKWDKIMVDYRTRVPHVIYGEGEYYYNCIVVSITATDGRIYNMSFFIAESEAGSGDGIAHEKGDYLHTWITSS